MLTRLFMLIGLGVWGLFNVSGGGCSGVCLVGLVLGFLIVYVGGCCLLC